MARKLVIGRCVHNYKPVACYGECGTHCPIWSNFTDPDPVAIWTPNPKEYAGEADAIEELAPLWGYECMGKTWYSGEFTVMRGARPAKSLADRIKEIEMGKTHFASIAPRYPSEDTRRAPRPGDSHWCDENNPRIPISYVAAFDEWVYGYCTHIRYPCAKCPHCGGLLPTQDKHEGNAPVGNDLADFARHYIAASENRAVKREREDAEIREFWANRENKKDDARTFAILSKNPQAVYLIDFVRYSNTGVRMSAAPKENIYGPNWHAYKSVVSQHPRNTQRTGAELLALLFSAPITGHKEAPSAWVAVEDGMPRDSETVLVKLEKDDEPDEPTLGYYHNFPRIGILWTYQKLGGEVKLDRHEGAVVNKVTHWRRIE